MPAMTDKLEKKVDRGNNLCCYSQRVCNLEKLKGFHFCHKHILEDKASPFKPCSFIAKSNGKRCTNPAPKMPDKEKSYCIIHTRKAELRRAVEEQRKRKKRTSVDELWIDMEEYRDHGKRRRTTSSTSHRGKDGSQKGDFQSSEEEEVSMDPPSGSEELSKVDSAWHGDADSDAESVNSEDEDPLKHAGVWTTEEAVRMCRDKMVRLRSLYIDQFKRLQHVLKEKRRKYLHAIQVEEENEFGESTVPVSQLLGRRTRKRHGAEALLHKQAKEKRMNFGARHQNMSHLRCTYTLNGNRCSDRILPLTKYCLRHVNQDLNQVLFERCSFRNGENQQCEGFIPRAFPHTTCSLHVQLPAQTMRTDVQKDLEEAKERDRDRKKQVLEQKVKTELSISLPCDWEQGSSMGSGEAASALLPPQKLLMPLGPTPPIIGSKLAVLVPPSEGQKENEVVEAPEQLKSRPTEPQKQTTADENVEQETTRVIDKGTSDSSSPTGSLSGIDISPSLAAASIIAVCSPQSSAGEVSICSKSQSVLPATSVLTQANRSFSSSANAKMATTSSLVYTSSTGTASVARMQEAISSGTPPNTNKKSYSITSIVAPSTSSSLVVKDSIQTSAIASAGGVDKSSSESLPSNNVIATFNESTSICASTAANTTTISRDNAILTTPATSCKSALPVSSSINTISAVSTAEKTQVSLSSVVTATSTATLPTVTNTSTTPAGQSLLATGATSQRETEKKLIPTSAVQSGNKKTSSSDTKTLPDVSHLSSKSVSGESQVIKNAAVQGIKTSNDEVSGSDIKTSASIKETEFQAKLLPSETPSAKLDCSLRDSKVERKMEYQVKEPEAISETPEKSSPVATEEIQGNKIQEKVV